MRVPNLAQIDVAPTVATLLGLSLDDSDGQALVGILQPSILVRPGWKIGLRERSKNVARISAALETLEGRSLPQWLEIEKDEMTGTIKAMPQREDITLPIDEQLIVELYSR